jgi:uncharacterized protein
LAVIVQALGVKCNIRCHYCFQNLERDAQDVPRSYDLEKIKAGVEKEGGPFTLWGGEPLLLPVKDLEELWAWGFQKYGKSVLQTNGSLLKDQHIPLLHKYHVQVGISIDGPGELNDVRWAGSLERTREATRKTEAAVERLCKEGLAPCVLVVLHRGNATRGKLPRMHDWVRHLQKMGVTSMRLHMLEVDEESVREYYALTTEENIEAFLGFLRLQDELTTLEFDVFRDLRNQLLGTDDQTTCIWHACDPYTTGAVRGVSGSGQRSNCSCVNKEGISFVKAAVPGFERYLALYHTPQEYGGCKGCRFFLMCKGQCPGHALDGDWRNRTADCEVWKALLHAVEQRLLEQGLSPVSLSPARPRLEMARLEAWATGQNPTTASTIQQLGLVAATAGG